MGQEVNIASRCFQASGRSHRSLPLPTKPSNLSGTTEQPMRKLISKQLSQHCDDWDVLPAAVHQALHHSKEVHDAAYLRGLRKSQTQCGKGGDDGVPLFEPVADTMARNFNEAFRSIRVPLQSLRAADVGPTVDAPSTLLHSSKETLYHGSLLDSSTGPTLIAEKPQRHGSLADGRSGVGVSLGACPTRRIPRLALYGETDPGSNGPRTGSRCAIIQSYRILRSWIVSESLQVDEHDLKR